MKRLLFAVLLLSSLAFAKDKTPEKPSLTAEQKLAYKQTQLALALAVIDAQPKEFMVDLKRQAAQAAHAELEKACGDLKKWKLNDSTLECDEIPVAQTETKPTEEKKP